MIMGIAIGIVGTLSAGALLLAFVSRLPVEKPTRRPLGEMAKLYGRRPD